LIPEDHREKPYLKDVKNFNGLIKKLDGAESLLGQRQIPGKDAAPEEWSGFFSKLAPEKVEDYGDLTAEDLPKDLVGIVNQGKFKELLKSAGANSYQAGIIQKGIVNLLAEAQQFGEKESAEKIQKLSSEMFGDEKDSIINNGKAYLAANLPEKMRGLIETMSEQELMLVIGTTDGLVQKLTGEDPFRGKGGTGKGSSADTVESLKKEMAAIIAEPAYRDPFKDREKHEELKKKMANVRDRLRKISG